MKGCLADVEHVEVKGCVAGGGVPAVMSASPGAYRGGGGSLGVPIGKKLEVNCTTTRASQIRT